MVPASFEQDNDIFSLLKGMKVLGYLYNSKETVYSMHSVKGILDIRVQAQFLQMKSDVNKIGNGYFKIAE
jgi:hypothetical protein